MVSEDHDLLIRIDERVGDILDEVKVLNGRICSLERWRWLLSGAIAMLALVFGGKMIFL